MSLTNPNAILFDINGNPYGVSGSMALPVGAIGQLAAGVDPSNNVQYLTISSGSAQIYGRTWDGGIQGVSASVALRTWDGGIQGMSASVPLQVWNAGLVGVSGSLSFSPTGSLLVGAPAYAPVYVAVSGNLPVFPGDGAVFPVQQQGQLQVSNFPATQAVSGTVSAIVGNWPATLGVSASFPLQVWSAGPIGVTGSFSSGPTNVYTSGPQAVSGTYQSGSVASAPIWPLLEGGLDTKGVVRPFLTDPQGRLTNPTTGSTVTSTASSTSNATVLFPNNQRVGATFFNEGPSTAFLKFGQVASQASYSVQMGAKAYYELPYAYQGQVDVVFNTNTGNLRVTELT